MHYHQLRPGSTDHAEGCQEWTMDPDIFDQFDEEFWFTLDAACDPHNQMCEYGITKKMDALVNPWIPPNDGSVWVNPPYGRGMVAAFLQQAVATCVSGFTTVAITHVRSGGGWFRDWIWGRASEYRLLTPLLPFWVGDRRGVSPIPHALSIYTPMPLGKEYRKTKVTLYNWRTGRFE